MLQPCLVLQKHRDNVTCCRNTCETGLAETADSARLTIANLASLSSCTADVGLGDVRQSLSCRQETSWEISILKCAAVVRCE